MTNSALHFLPNYRKLRSVASHLNIIPLTEILAILKFSVFGDYMQCVYRHTQFCNNPNDSVCGKKKRIYKQTTW